VYARHERRREAVSEGSLSAKLRDKPAPDLIRGTQMAYKAQSPGKLAQHNEAPGSGDRLRRCLPEAAELCAHQGERDPEAGYVSQGGRLRGDQPERPVASGQDSGHSDRYDPGWREPACGVVWREFKSLLYPIRPK
jgi:hypothetical protein